MRATACLALLCVALGIAALNTYSVGQKEAALEEQPVAARIPRWLHSEEEIAALRCVLQPQLKYVLRLVQLQQQDCNEESLSTSAPSLRKRTRRLGALFVLEIHLALAKARPATQGETQKHSNEQTSSRKSPKEKNIKDSISLA